MKMLSSPDEPELIRIQKIIKLENIIAAIWVYMFNKGKRVPFPPNMIRGGFVVMLEQKIRINAIHQTIK